MSSYKDHHPEPTYIRGRATDFSVTVDWREMTERKLQFLYGPNHEAERRAMTARDIAAWNNLGSGGRFAA